MLVSSTFAFTIMVLRSATCMMTEPALFSVPTTTNSPTSACALVTTPSNGAVITV